MEGIKIDGIPIQDYNGFTSETIYNDGFCISETPIIEEGIFLDGVKITTAEEWNKAIEEFRKRANDFIPKQKVRDKIEELKKQTSTINDKQISKKYSHTQFARECCIGLLKEVLEEEK